MSARVRTLNATASTRPLVRCEGLVVGRRGIACAPPIYLEIGAGERVAVTGRNGAGKTTFLKTLAGQLLPVAGKAQVLGMVLGRTHAHELSRSGLAYVGDDRGVFLTLSVRQQVELAIAMPFTIDLARSLTDPVATIASRPKRRVATLSGGERQVLGIGCALFRKPKVLIVDELTQGLQSETRHALLDRLMRTSCSQGLTVIFSDDHEWVIERLATHRLDLEDGTLS